MKKLAFALIFSMTMGQSLALTVCTEGSKTIYLGENRVVNPTTTVRYDQSGETHPGTSCPRDILLTVNSSEGSQKLVFINSGSKTVSGNLKCEYKSLGNSSQFISCH